MLIAYTVAIELVKELRPIVEKIRKHDSTLAKQLVDAMNSTVQNLAEGEAHRGGNKRAKYDIAHGEANEVKGSLDLALAWGYIADDSPARATLRRLLAMLWGLTNSQRLVVAPSRKPRTARSSGA
ncbi:MAG: four helix bundle protein [Deltaproteobacteria bacterium]|nr:four helix bundle protein [Deltaproteobacteria bacterium]